ncbi:MAG: guanylate kinase [Patescibacteria group bacterium]|jgi:guanylate kinase
MKRGIIFVIAGPTGAGETSVSKAVCQKIPNLKMTTTYTSRDPRPGEKNGVDYKFLSVKDFEKKIKAGGFLEYIKVLNRGHYYGTNKKDIEDKLKNGINIVINLELKGKKVIKKLYPNSLSIFIKPDRISRIKNRLITRDPGIDPEEFKKRLQNAKDELGEAKFYDYTVINYEGKMNDTVERIIGIIQRHLAKINNTSQ